MTIILNGKASNTKPEELITTCGKRATQVLPIINGYIPTNIAINGYNHPPVLSGCALCLPLWHSKLSHQSPIYSLDSYGYSCPVTGALWTPLGRVFDGVDDKIVIGRTSALEPTAITVIVWCAFAVTQNSAQFANPIGKDHSGTFGVTLQVDHIAPGINVAYWHIGNGATLQSIPHPVDNAYIKTGVFHQWCVTKGSTGMLLYRDGAADGGNASFTDPIVWSTSDWFIGVPNIPSRAFTGIIGETFIFNRALHASEISRIYLATKWRYQ